PVPFDARLSALKAHPGQVRTAARLRRLLAGSQIRESHRRGDPRVQDPYSLRCMPQVHGAVADALAYALRVVETEMDSVTDNPILAGGAVLSGGNFHGQALSMAYDHAALAMTVLGGISERRIFQLVSGQAPRLSPFLASDAGLESGYMMLQVTAAALASENKVLAHPASADSIPTSAFKEDFVSMGMGAALKFRQITVNSAQIAAIELLAAAQGLEAHKPLKPGKGVAKALSLLRAEVPASRGDEPMSDKMRIVKDMVLRGELERAAGAS
ncbi:MAG: aromatic amino acid lyase, partial [Elusimicrobiota bacterium]